MKFSTMILIAAMFITALTAGNAGAQEKVSTAPVFFDDAFEAALPVDGTVTLPLTGLKKARVAMVTFVKFVNAAPVQDAQVMTVMEGVTIRWAGTKDSCVYDVRLVASPPALTMTKQPGMCALKPPGNAVLRVVAM